MAWAAVIVLLFVFVLYLVVLLNKEKHDKYSWQKEVIYKDFINNKEIVIVTSSDSFTVSSLTKNNLSNSIILSFEDKISNLSDQPVPFKASLAAYMSSFFEYKNPFLGLSLMSPENIKLFNSEFKLEGPVFFIEKNIYNIYVEYKILNININTFLNINTMLEYESFLKDLYQYETNYICFVTYKVYKQIAKEERGKLTSSLILSTKIGRQYAHIDYTKPFLIDVKEILDS